MNEEGRQIQMGALLKMASFCKFRLNPCLIRPGMGGNSSFGIHHGHAHQPDDNFLGQGFESHVFQRHTGTQFPTV